MSSKRTRLTVFGASLALVGLVSACVADSELPGRASDDTDSESATTLVSGSIEEVCAAGAEEGSFVDASTGTPESNAALEAAFHKQYPDIAIERETLRPADITQRMLQEKGRTPSYDLIVTTPENVPPLAEAELLDTTIDWKALGVRESLISADNLVRFTRAPIGIIYNTDEVTEADLPNTWEELLTSSEWEGKVAVDPRGAPFNYFVLEWSEDEVLDYVNRLKETLAPEVIQGATAGAQTVIEPGNLVSTNGAAATFNEQASFGAPLGIKYLDVIPVSDYFQAIPLGAEHPNAAACWANWITSEAGAAVQAEVAYVPNDDVPSGAAPDAKLIVIENAEDAEAVADISAEITNIWSGES